MANCVQCSSSIPTGQKTCSMCYGDPDHGRDGYYQEWIDDQRREEEEEQQLEAKPRMPPNLTIKEDGSIIEKC